MSWKSLFIKDEEPEIAPEPTKTQPITKGQPRPLSGLSSAGPTTDTAVRIPGTGTDYNDLLDKAIRKANQPGLDFLEFTDNVDNMAGQPFTEEQKYTVIYPTYKAGGIDKGALIASGQKYLAVVDQEAADFAKEMDSTIKTDVTDKMQKAVSLQKEIEELQKKIADKVALSQQLTQESNASKVSLDQEKVAFENAVEVKKGQINDHINKIQTYLK